MSRNTPNVTYTVVNPNTADAVRETLRALIAEKLSAAERERALGQDRPVSNP